MLSSGASGYISVASIVSHGHPRLRKELGLIYLALPIYVRGNGRTEEEGVCNNACRVTFHSLGGTPQEVWEFYQCRRIYGTFIHLFNFSVLSCI